MKILSFLLGGIKSLFVLSANKRTLSNHILLIPFHILSYFDQFLALLIKLLAIECLLRLTHTPDLNGNSYIQSITKDTGKKKWSLSCISPEIIKLVLTWLSLQEPDQTIKKCSTAAIYEQDLPSPHFPVLIEVRSVFTTLWVLNYFPLYNHYPTDKISQVSHYFYDKCSDQLHS